MTTGISLFSKDCLMSINLFIYRSSQKTSWQADAIKRKIRERLLKEASKAVKDEPLTRKSKATHKVSESFRRSIYMRDRRRTPSRSFWTPARDTPDFTKNIKPLGASINKQDWVESGSKRQTPKKWFLKNAKFVWKSESENVPMTKKGSWISNLDREIDFGKSGKFRSLSTVL